VDVERVQTDEGDLMIVNMGPQHPSTHGVLRLVVELDGENVMKATPHIGYLHTGLEKTMESMTYYKALTITDREDYLSNLMNNLAYSLAVEKLMDVEIPERARRLRLILNELERIASHLLWLGTHALDIGAMTLFFYTWRERDQILDMKEVLSGVRADFVEMFVGVGASRVRDLFDTAKANRPSLIFIDEIDAVGRQRGAGLGGGHDEREQTLNQLLVEMDGFDPNSGVIMIAATNRPDVLDPALLRPGRFDRHVTVDTPDAKGREAILNIHLKGKPLGEDVSSNQLARRTPGFTGADLANLVNEATLLAVRRNKVIVDMEEFNESIDRVVAGPERKSRIMSPDVREKIAYHEIGHAVVGELLPHANPVHKVSILPRGRALGYTMQYPTEDKYLTTRQEFLDDVSALLAGRVAEELVYGEVTTGASNDFERATAIARAMVCEYGMSDRLGPVVLGTRHGNPFLGRDWNEERNYSETIAVEIDKEVRSIIDSCYERSRQILSDNRAKMDEIVKVLLEKESLEREEFIALMEGAQLPAASPQPPAPPSPPGDSTPAASPKSDVSRRLPKLRPEPA
jgi:cell division protease FtsH